MRRLIDTLCSFGEGYAAELTTDDFSDEEGSIRIIEAIENCQIDIFVRMQGLHLGDFSEDARYFETSSGVQIPYLGSKSLIALKSKSLREKDRLDVSILQDMLRSSGT